MENYLYQLSTDYPEIANISVIGRTHENRELILLKISSGIGTNKPSIFIEGGIHAREWISPAQVLYIADQLVTNASNKYLYQNVDWYLLPMANPDGYEYASYCVSKTIIIHSC